MNIIFIFNIITLIFVNVIILIITNVNMRIDLCTRKAL